MRAEDIADYLAKKTAKPIAYDVAIVDSDKYQHRFYSIEVVGVRDSAVEAMVAFKHSIIRGKKVAEPRHCGETTIPIRDGDTIQGILDMAIATTDFAEFEGNIEDQQDRLRFRRAYKTVKKRLEDEPAATPPGP